MWNGFIRGLYREHYVDLVSQDCFGDWIEKNLTHLDDIAGRVFSMTWDITYDEAQEAAHDAVNLMYKNFQFC